MTQDEIIRMAREAGAFRNYFDYGVEGFAFVDDETLERFAALVAEPWIETNKALAKEIIELHKQAEQEPDYFGLTHDHTWLSIDKKQYDKLKPEGRMTCYAAPVHTKDLTDEEIAQAVGSPLDEVYLADFRAVIAAYKEKNK